MPIRGSSSETDARIAIVRSSYYEDLVTSMEQSARMELMNAGIPEEHITLTQVPGAFEIPLACAHAFESLHVDCCIALGVIIEGETFHAQEISRACSDGLMHIQMQEKKPITHEVLYVHNREQAEARCLGSNNKGAEAARTCMRMLQLK